MKGRHMEAKYFLGLTVGFGAFVVAIALIGLVFGV